MEGHPLAVVEVPEPADRRGRDQLLAPRAAGPRELFQRLPRRRLRGVRLLQALNDVALVVALAEEI